jgi:hypothetical protein
MKAHVMLMNGPLWVISDVLQVTTVFMGHDEDDLKYNHVAIIYKNSNGEKVKTTYQLDSISSVTVVGDVQS